jgi:hypothetical protein
MPPQPGLPTHDHDCDEGDCGVLYSLYKEIDLPQVCCPNVTIISRPNKLVLVNVDAQSDGQHSSRIVYDARGQPWQPMGCCAMLALQLRSSRLLPALVHDVPGKACLSIADNHSKSAGGMLE